MSVTPTYIIACYPQAGNFVNQGNCLLGLRSHSGPLEGLL